MTKTIHVLGIESSCDDTGVSIINQDGKILSNCVHSQLKQHLEMGGIVPVMAREYHLANIDRVARQAFRESNLNSVAKDIDAIAVTTRPGLKFSLQIGLNYARTLAKKYSKPLIPIHHMQAHALMPLLTNRSSIKFPFMVLLLSGGHCILSLAKRYNDFHILGETRDEAPGDLLDKFARRLRLRNLGPPFDHLSGGASIELLGKMEAADRFKYFNTGKHVPMLTTGDCDFSFAGYRDCLEQVAPSIDSLWSAGDRERLLSELSHVCASLQRIMLSQIARRLHRAIMFYRMCWRYQNEDSFKQEASEDHLGFPLRGIDEDIDVVVSGGVAANKYFVDGINMLVKSVQDSDSAGAFAPTKSLCSDNGLMIAWNGLLRYQDFMAMSSSIGARPKLGYGYDVVCDVTKLDQIEIEVSSRMGKDIRDEVKLANFKLGKLAIPEFKLAH